MISESKNRRLKAEGAENPKALKFVEIPSNIGIL